MKAKEDMAVFEKNVRDEELGRDYVRVKRRPDSTLILVRTIWWGGCPRPCAPGR
jgi:hypothetical protein